MSEHFTRSTVSATLWCAKCHRVTPHRIDDKRKGPCLVCIERLEIAHNSKASTPAPPVQASLFPIDEIKKPDRRLEFPFGSNV